MLSLHLYIPGGLFLINVIDFFPPVLSNLTIWEVVLAFSTFLVVHFGFLLFDFGSAPLDHLSIPMNHGFVPMDFDF